MRAARDEASGDTVATKGRRDERQLPLLLLSKLLVRDRGGATDRVLSEPSAEHMERSAKDTLSRSMME